MKKIIICVIAYLLLVGCSGRKVKKVFFNNGKLKKVYEVIDDTLKDGYYKSYYNNGQVFRDVHYKNEKLDGKYLAYYSNGILNASQNYKSDKIDGESIYFYENGKLEQIGEYLNGLPNGKFLTYYSNGNLKDITYYQQDTGLRTEYYDSLSGKLTGITTSAKIDLGLTKYHNGDSLSAKIHVNDIAHFRDVRPEIACLTWQQYLDYEKSGNLTLTERRPFVNDYIYREKLKISGHYIIIAHIVFSDTLSSDRQRIEIKKEFDVLP